MTLASFWSDEGFNHCSKRAVGVNGLTQLVACIVTDTKEWLQLRRSVLSFLDRSGEGLQIQC